jgi:acetoin utilization deacetylase AcuC-like enzyme
MNENVIRRTGVVHSEKFKEHDTGEGHPESPSRMGAVSRALKAESVAESLVSIEPRPAEKKDVLLVHTERLFNEVLATQEQGRTYLDEDTVTSSGSAEAALLAIGAVLSSAESVLERDVATAFAFVRPPGHHAKPDKAMGFCLFNNVAVAAQHLIRNHGLERVLIVDFDLHHGNGTQKAFYTSPEVLYISTHQWPHYPGTGTLDETGKETGRGFTLNIPLPAGMGDAEFTHLYREIIGPVGREFRPQFVLVSAGFDAHHKDPLGAMRLTPIGYAALVKEILDIADESCDGKTVFSLEGGYDLAGLEESIVSALEVITTRPAATEAAPSESALSELVDSISRVHGEFWSCLRR